MDLWCFCGVTNAPVLDFKWRRLWFQSFGQTWIPPSVTPAKLLTASMAFDPVCNTYVIEIGSMLVNGPEIPFY